MRAHAQHAAAVAVPRVKGRPLVAVPRVKGRPLVAVPRVSGGSHGVQLPQASLLGVPVAQARANMAEALALACGAPVRRHGQPAAPNVQGLQAGG